MEARKTRHIKPGYEYDRLFPASENDNKTIRRNADVYDTVAFISKVVHDTLPQTKRIAQQLKGSTLYDTCRNIWHFVYGHINYKKDQEGYEQIRSPARTWHDRKVGVDCDCYSVFISSILANLGIRHTLRITKYHRDYFQHIYPVVPASKKEIVIDCVTDKFDYEVPYSEKKDYPMDLQYLNGFDGDCTEELGKVIRKNMVKSKTNPAFAKSTPMRLSKKMQKAVKSSLIPSANAGSSLPAAKKKKKAIFKKMLNVVNKVNPATVLLRNGVLAAMKLNIKNVAKRLRWSYLTQEQASAKGIDLERFQKLVKTRQKLEEIFYGAGGSPGNLKKAILKGKGNKDKAVSGLGMLPMIEWHDAMNASTPLDQVLGRDIFISENVEGMQGFRGLGELGEPITLASIGAAMGVIAGIVASLKSVGDIFKKKGKESEDFDESKTDAPENNISSSAANATTTATSNSSSRMATSDDVSSSSGSANENTLLTTSNNGSSNEAMLTTNSESQTSEDKTVATKENTDSTTNAGNQDDNKGFWEKNKKWLKPAVIGIGGLTAVAIAYSLSKSGKSAGKASPVRHALAGIPKRKKKKKFHKQHNRKSKHRQKHAVALI